ncbi:phosphoadenosine phosphosulfate reductase [Pseudomonas sp. SO81]|uniref:phosphoadenosine phosphosulfate reductase n=1 Tax=Pseudomonas sp. SO81 TaxID=2983246 RepID=UPI0025A488A6|nr:phosphoadenosine phosphosulfate reductase [Pseudomonas sp. SO81]WJN61318.1 hypothetical protein OH686_21450 [Pseudomonas sp. SO81]
MSERAPVAVAYGAGTNSTALLVEMVRLGEPVDAILFADTGGERPGTYAYRDLFSAWLVERGYPAITTVQASSATLEEDCLRRSALPALSYGFKTCSIRFKQQPQTKWLNNWRPAKAAWARGQKVVKLIGYDLDEPHRGKPFEDDKFVNRYPLLEWGWGREECVAAIAAAGLPQPGKSSCFYCPSMTKPEILQLRKEHPDLLIRALNIETTAKNAGGLDSVNGLGRKLNWGDFIELVDEAEANDPTAFFLRQQDFPNPPQCGGCYDGRSLDADEQEPAA